MRHIFYSLLGIITIIALSASILVQPFEAHAVGKKKIRVQYHTQSDGLKLKVKTPSKLRIVRVKRNIRNKGFVTKDEIFESPVDSGGFEEANAATYQSPRGGGVMSRSNCRNNCSDSCTIYSENSGGSCETIWFWTWATGIFNCVCH